MKRFMLDGDNIRCGAMRARNPGKEGTLRSRLGGSSVASDQDDMYVPFCVPRQGLDHALPDDEKRDGGVGRAEGGVEG
jgi:hypothetical protein